MNRAQLIAIQLDSRDEIYDQLIDEIIEPRFLSQGAKQIALDESIIANWLREMRREYKSSRVKSNLEMRGFKVERECEDRPCGRCTYIITIPPMKE